MMKTRKFLSRLTPAALLAVVLALTLAGGTLAWLMAQTDPITNTFRMGEVDVVIDEEFDYTTKSDVKLTNPNDPKNVPIYVRAALVPTWVNGDEQPVGVPASLSDLDIDWGTTDWIYNAPDGYYYYTKILPVNSSTTNLIDTATAQIVNGNHMNLQVIADGVQAQPKEAVESVWPVTVGENGTLSVKGGG